MKHVQITSFLRFCAVGAVNTVVDFGVFFLCYYGLRWPLLLANGIAFSAAVTGGYHLNKNWTFRGGSGGSIIKFAVVALGGLAVSSLVIYFASLYMPVIAAKIVAIGAALVWNYAGSSLFVFRAR